MSSDELLMAASAACSVAFYIGAGLVHMVRRPQVPPSLPATSDLGSESPAVANLLANGGELTPEAVPATLLDLAARRAIQIDEKEPRVYEVRIGSPPPAGLTAYESRVISLLRQKASGGVVPAAALTTGASGEAKSWHVSFNREVVSEARKLGFTKPRWPPQVLSALGLLLFGAFVLVALAANDDNHLNALWVGTLTLALVTIGISNRILRDNAQLVTTAGLPKQARWLSLRKYLHDDELFATLPPTAVVVRERYLAYGAALGVAAAAVRAMPMGSESDSRAWSSYGGHWRQVSVSYPKVWPPAYGASPGESIWRGVRLGSVAAVYLWVFAQLLPHLLFTQRADQLTRDLSAVAVLGAAIALVVLGTGLWLLLAGLISLVGTAHVTGDAVRLRRFGSEASICYLAVDDGTRDRIRAWKVRPAIYDALTEYSTVTVSVTPLLSYVRHVHRAGVPVASAAAPARV
ncbi:MAG: DUF2207 domain-containing protein [Chloroflexi bacterium]|nr:MAG: DUF2207 domain-containing protein [Chloroflexota bacterium]